MILQLNPMIPVNVLEGKGWPLGLGQALALLDYSSEHNTLWLVGYDKTGELWWIPQKYVRLQANMSLERMIEKP